MARDRHQDRGPPLMVLPPQSRPPSVRKRGHAARPGSGPAGETCGSCGFYASVQSGRRRHPKCARMAKAWTQGGGTDIRKKDPACEQWAPIMVERVVKVQRPLNAARVGARFGRRPADLAMIYDEQRLHMQQRPLLRKELRLMGKDMKIYCRAQWTGQTWKLGLRVDDQQW